MDEEADILELKGQWMTLPTKGGGNVTNPTNPITSALASQLDNLVGQGALTDKAEGSSDLTLKDCTPKDGPVLKQLAEGG